MTLVKMILYFILNRYCQIVSEAATVRCSWKWVHGKTTDEWYTDDIRVHTSDIRVTYEYIRVTYRWHTSTCEWHTRLYEWHTSDIRVHTNDIRMTCKAILNCIQHLKLLDGSFFNIICGKSIILCGCEWFWLLGYRAFSIK